MVRMDTDVQDHEQTPARLTYWLCTAAGFYLAAYANDVMQYPNSIPIYTAFALCFAGPYIDKRMQQSKETELKNEQ